MMAAADLASFIGFHLGKDFSFTSIKNGTKVAVSKGLIDEPSKHVVQTSYGERQMPLYDEKSCCFFIKKYASQTDVIVDLMEVGFNIYVQSLYISMLQRTDDGEKKVKQFITTPQVVHTLMFTERERHS